MSNHLFAALAFFGLGIAQCHYAILRGWPLVLGSGAVLVLVGLITAVMACIGIFSAAVAKAMERDR